MKINDLKDLFQAYSILTDRGVIQIVEDLPDGTFACFYAYKEPGADYYQIIRDEVMKKEKYYDIEQEEKRARNEAEVMGELVSWLEEMKDPYIRKSQ